MTNYILKAKQFPISFCYCMIKIALIFKIFLIISIIPCRYSFFS